MLTPNTRSGLFAEWHELSMQLSMEPPAGIADPDQWCRLEWSNQELPHRKLPVASWSRAGDLTEGEGKFLLKKMQEESGRASLYRALLIGKLAVALFGGVWQSRLVERLRARFQRSRPEDLTPGEAHAEIEELLRRISVMPGESGDIEQTRRKYGEGGRQKGKG